MATDVIPPNGAVEGGSPLKALSTADVRKLYRLSRGVRALAFFWLLAAAMAVVLVAAGTSSAGSVIYPVFAVLACAAFFGTLRLRTWGRFLSMVLCAVILFAYPLGTIFGLLGLVTLVGSKSLFGPDGFSQDRLKRELMYRKANPQLQSS